MKELKVTVTAICTVPDDYQWHPHNHVNVTLDDGTERRMMTTHLKVEKPTPIAGELAAVQGKNHPNSAT